MAVSECPPRSPESTTKDVGIIANEGGEWEIYIGGASGVSVRKGDVLCRVKSQAEALRITARFLQYYQEHARYLERTYDFIPRIGIEKLTHSYGRRGRARRGTRRQRAEISRCRRRSLGRGSKTRRRVRGPVQPHAQRRIASACLNLINEE